MRNKLPILIFLPFVFFVVIAAAAYYLRPARPPVVTASPRPTTSSLIEKNKDYEVVVKADPKSSCAENEQGPCVRDFYLKDSTTAQEHFFATIDSSVEDSRGAYYKKGTLFLVKRTGNSQYPSTAWTDELWAYTGNDQGKLLYSEKGFYYVINNAATEVAVSKSTDQFEIIKVSDPAQSKSYQVNQDACVVDKDRALGVTLSLRTWDSKDTTLWGDFDGEYAIDACFWKLDVNTGTLSYYPVTPYVAHTEFNPEKRVALYIDKPPFVDEDSYNAWKASNPTYALYMYYLDTKKSVKIDTIPSGSAFGLKGWRSQTEFVYDTPKGEKVYTLR